MLTVYCVYWGDKYSIQYPRRLQMMVARNLSLPHRFVCISDKVIDGVETVKPLCDYPFWWQKIGLFHPDLNDGPAIYFDLDVVITGNLDGFAAYTGGGLWMPRNWSNSGHSGWQSSVMAWRGSDASEIFTSFDFERDSPRLWGDQEFITELMGDRVHEIPLGEIISYKYHCRGRSLPEHAKVVCFHGKPDYHEVSDSWVKRALLSTQTSV